MLRDLSSVKHDSIYMRLARQPDGIAIGRTAMPNLPSSRREVLIGAGRSNTSPFVSSTVKTIPTDYIMSGSAQFAITIDKDARIEVAGARPPKSEKPEDKSKPEEPKPKLTPKSEPVPPNPVAPENPEH